MSDDITIAEWRAVVGLMDRKLADSRTNRFILPHEIEAWKIIRAKALAEITGLMLRNTEQACKSSRHSMIEHRGSVCGNE